MIAGRSESTPRGAHGDLVVTVVAHHGGTRLAAPLYVRATQARLLLTTYFDATAPMVDQLLADTYAQRRSRRSSAARSRPHDDGRQATGALHKVIVRCTIRSSPLVEHVRGAWSDRRVLGVEWCGGRGGRHGGRYRFS